MKTLRKHSTHGFINKIALIILLPRLLDTSFIETGKQIIHIHWTQFCVNAEIYVKKFYLWMIQTSKIEQIRNKITFHLRSIGVRMLLFSLRNNWNIFIVRYVSYECRDVWLKSSIYKSFVTFSIWMKRFSIESPVFHWFVEF